MLNVFHSARALGLKTESCCRILGRALKQPRRLLRTCLELGVLRQHVQRADGQDKLVAVRELADTDAQGNQVLARNLSGAEKRSARNSLAGARTLMARFMMSSRT